MKLTWLQCFSLQARSPVKTLDELHICEMPAFPCFPTAEERLRECGGLAALKSPRTPRCYVITARARSFLYHQVIMKALSLGIGSDM
jgi:tRNA pseudouridine38-40 synthase